MADETPTPPADGNRRQPGQWISRRTFLAGGTAFGMTVAGLGSRAAAGRPLAQARGGAPASGSVSGPVPQDLALVNGKIHTMDGSKRVVSRALIQNGRFTAVGNNLA